MSTSAAGDLGAANPSHYGGAKKLAIVAAKLVVTVACFWYLWRQIDVSQVVSTLPSLDFRWVAFATLVIVLEIPLLALRWGNVVAALAARNERMTHIVMIAITAIGQFFVQVLPSVAGDGAGAHPPPPAPKQAVGGWNHHRRIWLLDRAINNSHLK